MNRSTDAPPTPALAAQPHPQHPSSTTQQQAPALLPPSTPWPSKPCAALGEPFSPPPFIQRRCYHPFACALHHPAETPQRMGDWTLQEFAGSWKGAPYGRRAGELSPPICLHHVPVAHATPSLEKPGNCIPSPFPLLLLHASTVSKPGTSSPTPLFCGRSNGGGHISKPVAPLKHNPSRPGTAFHNSGWALASETAGLRQVSIIPCIHFASLVHTPQQCCQVPETITTDVDAALLPLSCSGLVPLPPPPSHLHPSPMPKLRFLEGGKLKRLTEVVAFVVFLESGKLVGDVASSKVGVVFPAVP
ncbi:hypothetical protein K474DRAFT_1704271 [Panus rudis PR-1116 ss-1]|nr:hypothetical protein K474DRAFT_1704271 [Panus rudis PR-1116 ss-1]